MNKLKLLTILVAPFLGFTQAFAACSFSAPVAVDDMDYTVGVNQVLTVPASSGILSNDLPGTDGSGGTATLSTNVITQPTRGKVVVNPDGSFVYTPDKDSYEEDSFLYRANDGCQDSQNARVVIKVSIVNESPVVTIVGDNPYRLNLNETLPGGLTALANDLEDGDIPVNESTNLNSSIPGQYYIVYSAMDKFKAFGYATRTITVAAVLENAELLCGDGIDNDFNNLADRDDPSCVAFYNKPPMVSLLTPVNGETISGTVTLSATSTDDSAVASLVFYVDGVATTTTLNTNFLTNATHTISVVAFDGGGLSATSTISVLVNNPVLVSTTTTSSNTSSTSGGGGGGGGYIPVINNIATTTIATTSIATSSKPIGMVLGASTVCTPYLDLGKDILARGHKNNLNNLLLLKKFLNKNLKLSIDLNEFFGQQTEKAVKDFQLKYKSEILTPYGFKKPTGMVGKATAAKINSLSCIAM